jgi:hypothetical protein
MSRPHFESEGIDAFVPEDGNSLVDCYSLERKAQFMIYKDEDRPRSTPPIFAC